MSECLHVFLLAKWIFTRILNYLGGEEINFMILRDENYFNMEDHHHHHQHYHHLL